MVSGGEATATLFTMPPTDRSNLVFTQVTCKNRIVEAIVDTGAGITVISPDLCKQLNFSLHKRWGGPHLLMAIGTIVRPDSSVSLELIINRVPVYVEAAVLALNGYELLLGNNAL